MEKRKEKKSIKGIKEELIGKFKSSRDKEKVWGLQKKKTKIKEKSGKVVVVPSNSYTIDEEKGKGFVYYEGVPKGTEVYAAYYIDKAVENTEEKERRQRNIKSGNLTGSNAFQTKENNTANNKNKKNTWKIIPIVIILGTGILSLRGCTSEQAVVEQKQAPVVEQKVVPFEHTIYETENPSIPTWGIQGQAAQEGKFVNEMQGQGAEGDFYNSHEVYDKENQSAKDSEKYENLEEEFSKKLKSLEGNEVTKADLTNMQEMIENMDHIYEEKEEVVDEKLDEFLEDVDRYPDENTQVEKETANILSEEFYKNKGLVEENKVVVEDLTSKTQTGKVQINDISEEKDGDIRIKGEHIVEIVKQEKITGIKAAIKNVKGYFKGLFAQKSEEER